MDRREEEFRHSRNKGVTNSEDVALLAAIADTGSLSGAGRRIGLSPPSVSTRLADLEQRLGVVLLRRSSRLSRLTPEGEVFLSTARPILAMLEAAEGAARMAMDPSAAIAGPVHLGAPTDLGRQYVAGMVHRFMATYPRVEVSLTLADDLTDLAADGLDLAIRYGDMADLSSLRARILARNRRVVCGAPAYLDQRGRPQRPSDLAAHNCLCLRTPRTRIHRWPIGRDHVLVRGDRTANEGGVLRDWALAGVGLILKSWWDVRDDLAAGRLEALFGHLPEVPHPLRLVRPSGKDVPIRVRRLSDYLRTEFARLGQQDAPSVESP